jgi:CPA1 family monovalent cation:H+ antiporter
MAGLRTFYGNILDEDVDLRLELSGIGRLLALTPNDEVNMLAGRRFAEVFGGAETYQLAAAAPPPGIEGTVVDLGGRVLFGSELDYATLRRLFESGAGITRTGLTEAFDAAAFSERHGPEVIVTFNLRGGRLSIATADQPVLNGAQPGDEVFWLSVPGREAGADRSPQG